MRTSGLVATLIITFHILGPRSDAKTYVALWIGPGFIFYWVFQILLRKFNGIELIFNKNVQFVNIRKSLVNRIVKKYS
jgi:hypothetical protein